MLTATGGYNIIKHSEGAGCAASTHGRLCDCDRRNSPQMDRNALSKSRIRALSGGEHACRLRA